MYRQNFKSTGIVVNILFYLVVVVFDNCTSTVTVLTTVYAVQVLRERENFIWLMFLFNLIIKIQTIEVL